MRKWQAATTPEREARYAEYFVLVDELARKIEAALDVAAVIPFSPRRFG